MALSKKQAEELHQAVIDFEDSKSGLLLSGFSNPDAGMEVTPENAEPLEVVENPDRRKSAQKYLAAQAKLDSLVDSHIK